MLKRLESIEFEENYAKYHFIIIGFHLRKLSLFASYIFGSFLKEIAKVFFIIKSQLRDDHIILDWTKIGTFSSSLPLK